MENKRRYLNIAHLHWGFPPIIGGVETHLTILLPEMGKMGHSVSLLTGSVQDSQQEFMYKGVMVNRTPIMDLNWLYKRGLEGLEDEITEVFAKFFKKVKPDIIHAHNMHYFSEVHARCLESFAEKLSCPLVLTAHNVWDDLQYLEITHKINWTHIIAVSHYIKKEMIGDGVDDTIIRVIHHGIDQNKFKPIKPPASLFKKYPKLNGRRIIFHPARIGLAKGCDISIKSINLIKKKYPDILFMYAGSRNIIDWGETQQRDIAYLVNLIKHFNLENNVMIDVYPLEEMHKLYAASDIVIYPSSVGEPFGLVMLESMAMEKPIIVTQTGGMPEIVKDGINGFVIPVRDFEALSQRITHLLDDEVLRNRLGTTGRQMIESEFTKRKMAMHTLMVYKKLLN